MNLKLQIISSFILASISGLALPNEGRIFSLNKNDYEVYWSDFKRNFGKSYENSSHETKR